MARSSPGVPRPIAPAPRHRRPIPRRPSPRSPSTGGRGGRRQCRAGRDAAPSRWKRLCRRPSRRSGRWLTSSTPSQPPPATGRRRVIGTGGTICTPKSPACGAVPVRRALRGAGGGDGRSLSAQVAQGGKGACAAAPPSWRCGRTGPSPGAGTQRPKGLLGGMTEVPGTSWAADFDVAEALDDVPLAASMPKLPGTVGHVFTHFPLELTGVPGRVRRPMRRRAAAGCPPARDRRCGLPHRVSQGPCARPRRLKGVSGGLLFRGLRHLGANARNASIGLRPRRPAACQKVQPLQASRPCASAPIRWIEPTVSPSEIAPSARTSAFTRRLPSIEHGAGR